MTWEEWCEQEYKKENFLNINPNLIASLSKSLAEAIDKEILEEILKTK